MKRFFRGSSHSLALPGWVRGLCSQSSARQRIPISADPSPPRASAPHLGRTGVLPAGGTVLGVGTAGKALGARGLQTAAPSSIRSLLPLAAAGRLGMRKSNDFLGHRIRIRLLQGNLNPAGGIESCVGKD